MFRAYLAALALLQPPSPADVRDGCVASYEPKQPVVECPNAQMLYLEAPGNEQMAKDERPYDAFLVCRYDGDEMRYVVSGVVSSGNILFGKVVGHLETIVVPETRRDAIDAVLHERGFENISYRTCE